MTESAFGFFSRRPPVRLVGATELIAIALTVAWALKPELVTSIVPVWALAPPIVFFAFRLAMDAVYRLITGTNPDNQDATLSPIEASVPPAKL